MLGETGSTSMLRTLLLGLSLLASCGIKNIDDDSPAPELPRDGLVRGEDPAPQEPAEPPAAIADLASAERYQQAIEALVARGEDALPELERAAAPGGDLPVRGRAILALARIPGERAEALLLAIQDDSEDVMLARTWAAAARIQRAEHLDDVLGFAPLLSTMPALARPLSLRVQATAGELEDIPGALRLIEADEALGAVLSEAILARGPEPLSRAALTGDTQRVRQLAAGFLATLIQRDPAAADVAADSYRFDPRAEAVPWAGGPLYIPAAAWDGDRARRIVGGLITWYLFADQRGDQEAKRQILNNLRSVNLSGPAGLGWVDGDPVQLLGSWADVVGREGAEAVLEPLGLEGDGRYAAALEGRR